MERVDIATLIGKVGQRQLDAKRSMEVCLAVPSRGGELVNDVAAIRKTLQIAAQDVWTEIEANGTVLVQRPFQSVICSTSGRGHGIALLDEEDPLGLSQEGEAQAIAPHGRKSQPESDLQARVDLLHGIVRELADCALDLPLS